MQDVYRANPAMGDADTVTQQISASTTKIDKLHDEISQLEVSCKHYFLFCLKLISL